MVRALGIMGGLLLVAFEGGDYAFGASSTVFGIERSLWDLSWRWINFGILVYFILKYLKGPVVNFIKGRQLAIAGVFDEIAEKERALERRRRELEELLAGLDEKIKAIKAYYHEIGQEEKNKILAQADRTRRQILEEAKLVAAREFEDAKKRFRAEVVEAAVAMAEERIRKKMTKNDHRLLLENYILLIQKAQGSAETAEP
ncbi:MAG: ATP synthase F0 subunit B [Desulfosoma sp.]